MKVGKDFRMDSRKVKTHNYPGLNCQWVWFL